MGNTTCAKDTFWNDLRKQKGVTLKAVSAALDMDQATVSHYFTGMKLPSTPTSVKICDYFGIDYATGAAEFNKAHEAWVAENPGSKKKRSHIRSRKFDVKNISTTTSKPQVMNTLISDKDYFAPADVPVFTVPDTIELPLPTLTVTAKISDTKRDSILRLIYNKVDYDTYNEVVKVIDS